MEEIESNQETDDAASYPQVCRRCGWWSQTVWEAVDKISSWLS